MLVLAVDFHALLAAVGARPDFDPVSHSEHHYEEEDQRYGFLNHLTPIGRQAGTPIISQSASAAVPVALGCFKIAAFGKNRLVPRAA